MNLDTFPTVLLTTQPALYLLVALGIKFLSSSLSLRLGRLFTGLACVASLAALALGTALQHPIPSLLSGHAVPATGLIMLALVSFIGLVIYRYSERYLDAEPGRHRYDIFLQLTLASVTFVVLSDHLLLLLAGWIAISFSLHNLLTFYPDRPRALLAAHKKFLFARLAEACLLAAFVLLFIEHGSWSIREIAGAYPAASMEWPHHAAALLIVIAALIKSAQLPLHGWLIQVVEAPTPVSALLHAGVVNLGGYLLILLGPIWFSSGPAVGLLLVVAGVTVVVAALAMAVRVSIKVSLAWSTCAQMGLMLLECALGLHALALLHLVAHSCYKAHAFLGAGNAANVFVAQAKAPRAATLGRDWITAALLAALPVALLATVWGPLLPLSPWVLLYAALIIVLAERSSTATRGNLLFFFGAAVLFASSYAGLKFLFSQGVALGDIHYRPAADGWVILVVGALALGHLMLRHAPATRLARALEQQLYSGLYLDEWATRVTRRVWPLHLPPCHTPKPQAAWNTLKESAS